MSGSNGNGKAHAAMTEAVMREAAIRAGEPWHEPPVDHGPTGPNCVGCGGTAGLAATDLYCGTCSEILQREYEERTSKEGLVVLGSPDNPRTTNPADGTRQKRYEGRMHGPDAMTSLLQLPAEPTAWRVYGLVADTPRPSSAPRRAPGSRC
jgi:hypothetical protein